jgi:hypothetical protein
MQIEPSKTVDMDLRTDAHRVIEATTMDLAANGADVVDQEHFKRGARMQLADEMPQPDKYRAAAGMAQAHLMK